MRAAALAALLLLAGAAVAQPAARAATAAEAGEAEHVHTLQPGDTLIGLGQRLFAEPGHWREVARLNRVRDPYRMPVGSTLRIPLRLLRSEGASAAVTAVRGSVLGAGGTAALASGQQLAEGSEIVTGADGQASLRLVDGTVLRLRAGSRLRIDESRRWPTVDATRSAVRLEQGRVEVQAQPARGGQPGFRIGTPQGVLGVRGTEFRVESEGGRTRAEVLEGLVAASAVGAAGAAGAAVQPVAAGFGTVIDATGVATPLPLLPPPATAQLPALHERPLVRLEMQPLAGATAWRVQIGVDERFEQLLADVRSATPELRIAGLDDGRHPMRLRAVDANGLEGRDALATLVLKARPEPPLPRAPAPRAVIGGSRADFAWTASSQAQRYRVQIARVDAGTAAATAATAFAAPLRDEAGLTDTTLAVEGLAPGPYLWRLASVRGDGDQGPFGDPLPFEMRALPPPPAPPGPPTVGDDSLRLYWQGLPGQRFELQLARDAGFAELVGRHETERSEIELPLPGDGRFHVRLRARDADGFVGPWSAAQHFDLVPCVRAGSGGCWRVDGGRLQRP